ncbi:ABC transporter ATP-binding protein [Acholeplasma granularum]|uniref:ABC transporter ATP-binding protein n=1 Tax=Acholeplasma granularum TaxID=264635 RepID=UPI0004B3E16B|nr:ABC transporter ATP-binding protein [Acholeplasma granularum]
MSYVFEVKDLCFKYPKHHEDTIKSISFSVEKGIIFGLLGPSGAGKSTTQKILTKLLTGYNGTILYNGNDLSSYNKSYYENIGVGFEMPVHFNKLTALENLKYFAGLYQKTIDYEALLRRVGLYEAKDQMVGEFSKGMKIRLNFVRALINNPDVIFLDEPTNGLDPKNAKVIKDIIHELKEQGKTIFITTHLMGDVEQLCDKVVFITKGKISDVSTPRELKLKYGKKEVYVEYLISNSRKKETFSLQNIGSDTNFLDLIKNYDIETIHSGETSMEDIFIKVTGEEKYE